MAEAIRYDRNTKDQLVLKAADVVESQRIEWDKDMKEIPASFMAIRRTTTQSGGAMTFVADRTKDTGHAEAFWAIAHALHNELRKQTPITLEAGESSMSKKNTTARAITAKPRPLKK